MAKALINPARPAWSGGRRWLLRPALGLLLGGVALGWAVWGLEGTALVQTLGATSPGWLLVALLGVLAVAGVKAARWGALFGDAPARPPLSVLFPVLVAAQATNFLIPIRLGELVRLGMLKPHDVPAALTLSTIVAEKTADLLGTGLIAGALIALAVAPPWLRQPGYSLLALGLGLVVLLVIIIPVGRRWLTRLPHPANRPRLRRLAGVIITVLDSLSTLSRPRLLVKITGWSLLIWLVSLLTMLAVLAAFRLQLPLTAAVVLMLAANSSNIAPSPPALVGLTQGIAVAVLGWYRVDQATALGVGLWLNLIVVGPIFLLGGWVWWRRSLSLVSLLARPPAVAAPE